MRKRSKYRPKGVRLDTMAYVVEGLTPISQHLGVALDLKTKNHWALNELTKGRASRADIDVLIHALNMTEALCRLGIGDEYNTIINAGLRALRSVGGRGLATNKFILKADEMAALLEAMELHDAQLEVAVVRDLEKALDLVMEDMRNKLATPITATNT